MNVNASVLMSNAHIAFSGFNTVSIKMISVSMLVVNIFPPHIS